MDRIFLDANVLFSAAYTAENGLLRLWKLRETVIVSSRYAVEEARANLETAAQLARLSGVTEGIELIDAGEGELPSAVNLPSKDAPILLAAMAARCTHLITGDIRHFGKYFNKQVAGVMIMLPGDYLRSRSAKSK